MNHRQVLLVSFTCCLLVVAGGVVPVSSSADSIDAPPTPTEPTVAESAEEVSVEIVATPTDEDGVIEFTVEFSVPHSTSDFTYYIDKTATIQETTGFERADDSIQYKQFDLGTTHSPSMTYTVDVTEQNTDYGDYGISDEGTFGELPFQQAVWVNSDNDVERFSPLVDQTNSNVDVSTNDKGVLGTHTLYFGEYNSITIETDGKAFEFIVPVDVSDDVSVEDIGASLEAFDNRTQFQGHDPMFFISPIQSTGGYAYFGGDAVIGYEETLDTPMNIYIHEYVHTQQQFDTADETEWVVEGFADYLAVKANYQQSNVPKEDTREYLELDGDGQLNDPATWESHLDYYRGASVMAKIDIAIKQSTNGSNSVADVFYKLNAEYADEEVTEEEFIEVVNEVSETELTEFIEQETAASDHDHVEFEEWNETVPVTSDRNLKDERAGDENGDESGSDEDSDTDENNTSSDENSDENTTTEPSEINVEIVVTPEIQLGADVLSAIEGCDLTTGLCSAVDHAETVDMAA